MGRRRSPWLTQVLAIALAVPAFAQQNSRARVYGSEAGDDVGDYLTAIRAPAVQRQNLDSLYGSANGELANANYPAAEADFRSLYAQEPENTRGLEGVALVFLAEQRPDDALRFMQTELDQGPQRTDILLALVRIAVRAKAYDAATAALTRAIETPNRTVKSSSALYVKLSEVRAAQGDAAASLAALRMANRIAPRNVAIAMSLGQALEAGGVSIEAAEVYRAALGIDPQDGPALAACASENANVRENLDLALGCATLGVRVQPQDASTADLLGLIYLREGLPGKALPIYEQLLSEHPDPTYALHYGIALAGTGQEARAHEELARALALNPNQATAVQIRALLGVGGK